MGTQKKTSTAIKKRKLTEQQDHFCHRFIVDLDFDASFLEVFKRKPTNSDRWSLLKNLRILDRIRELKNERAERLELTADYVLGNVNEVVQRCMQAVPVFDRTGEPTGEWRFDGSTALKGLELLGKHLGIWVEKYQVSDPVQEVLAKKLDAMSPDQLREFIKTVREKKYDQNRVEPAGVRIISNKG